MNGASELKRGKPFGISRGKIVHWRSYNWTTYERILSPDLPARIALWTRNSFPPTERVTSLNFWQSNNDPRSSESLHSGTLNCTEFDWPEIFTLSATTLTCNDSSTLITIFILTYFKIQTALVKDYVSDYNVFDQSIDRHDTTKAPSRTLAGNSNAVKEEKHDSRSRYVWIKL